VVHLVVVACVLRATTKKVVNFFEEKSAPSEKIVATLVNLPTPGKNPAAAHGCPHTI